MKTLSTLLFLLIPIYVFCQDESFFCNEEFVFLNEEYSLKGEYLSNNTCEFQVELNGSAENFKINNISNTDVFKSKLVNTILDDLFKSHCKNVLNVKTNSGLRKIVNKIESEPNYDLNKIEKLSIGKEFDFLCKYLNCQSLYESSIIDSIYMLSSLSTTKSFFSERIDSCANNQLKNDSLYRVSLNSVAAELFPIILEDYKINRNDASEAGKIIVNRDIKVFDWNIYKKSKKVDKKNKRINRWNKWRKEENKKQILDNDYVRKEIRTYKDSEREETIDKVIIKNNSYEFQNSHRKDIPIWHFLVDSVSVEIFEGQIYNIKVIGTIDGELEIFENKFPIPFSTKNDINFSGNRWKKHKLESIINHWQNFIYLSDVLKYDYSLLELTENYTPKNQVLTIYPNSSGTRVFKEKNKEILEVKIFTDFIGLNDQNPNGLIQTEISRRLPFNTNVMRLGRTSFHTSFFNYINPHLDILKIEENNKSLNVSSMDSKKYVNFLDIDKHRNLAVGLDLNLMNFGMPRYHSLLHINLKTELSRIGLSESMILIDPIDSVSVENTNSFSKSYLKFSPEIIWHFNPSDKYQLQLSYRNHQVTFLDQSSNIAAVNDIEELTDIGTEPEDSQSSTIHEFEFLTTLKTNDTGRFFFRTRFNFLKERINKNYFQVQLGYSYLLLGRNK